MFTEQSAQYEADLFSTVLPFLSGIRLRLQALRAFNAHENFIAAEFPNWQVIRAGERCEEKAQKIENKGAREITPSEIERVLALRDMSTEVLRLSGYESRVES